jgi:chromosome segregation ATPase
LASVGAGGAGGAGGATPGAGLSLADPQEAELYVQRLRAHYGKEIAELRGALEALRDRMAASAEARDEDAARERADGARDTAEAVRLAELRARRAHDAELAVVRRELEATLARLAAEHADDRRALERAHARERDEMAARLAAAGDGRGGGAGAHAQQAQHAQQAAAQAQAQLGATLGQLDESTRELAALRAQAQRQRAAFEQAEAEILSVREVAERARAAGAQAQARCQALASEVDFLRARLADRDRELDVARSRRPSFATGAAGAGAGSITLARATLDVYGGGPPYVPSEDGGGGGRGGDSVGAPESVDDFASGPTSPIVASLRSEIADWKHRLSDELETRKRLEEYLESVRRRSDDEIAAAIEACSRAEARAEFAESQLRSLRGGDPAASSSAGLVSIEQLQGRAAAEVALSAAARR